MATTGKKEYTLKINGISEEIKNATSLLDALKAVNSEIERNTTITTAAAKPSKERARALTEEEKAAKKLEETQQKVKAAQEGANDAQIKANQALREATREQTLRIQGEQASTNSIEAMRIKLSQLKDDWKGLDVGTEEFRAMSEEIRVLNDQIKEAEQSTGDFRRNVGNYGSALEGLGRLSEGIDGVTKSSIGLAQGLLGANALMGMFGEQTEEDAKRVQQLQKIIALLSIAQQVNTNVLKEGIVQNKLAVVTDTIRTTQIKAKTAAEAASTKGTVAATIAQRIFNAVASANPYVLLALALLGVVGAMSAYSKGADSSTASAKKYTSSLTGLTFATKEARDAHDGLIRQIRDIQVEIDLANGKITEYQANLIRLSNTGADAIDSLTKSYKDNTDAITENYASFGKWAKYLFLEGNIFKTGFDQTPYLEQAGKEYEAVAKKHYAEVQKQKDVNDKKIEEANAKHNQEILRQNEDLQNGNLKGEAATLAQIETNRRRDLEVATTDNEKIKELNKDRTKDNQLALNDISAINAKYDKERTETLKIAGEAAISKRKELTQKELETIRTAEDVRIKLIENSDELARKTLEISYDRQIEDLKIRLATEKGLTVKARAALNETITSLEKQKGLDLEKLEKEQANRALALLQEVEDSRIALIVGNYDRQTAEVNLQYDRQIEAYKKRLDEDKTLTEEQQKQITELIINAQKERGIAITRITSEQLNQQADQQLTAVEDALKKVENKIGEVVVRNKTGLELIDVEATRKNLAATNAALDEYIAGLKKYLDEVKKAHEATLATLQEGTPEYEAELQKYARTVEDVTQRIKNAQKDQADNTKKSAEVQVEALRDLFGKIAKYADAAAMAVSSVMDTWNMGLQVQIDDLNEQLDALNERYEEAQKQREDAVKNVENIEAQLQAATGGTAEALKSQLQDSMHARAESEREERRLAKEKEKLEADVAKKEKQMKRNDLISKIAQGFANTALGVTQALSLVFPLNLVVAGLVGAMGLVQTGIMTKQLTKLADGGEIIGPSHANGGVPVPGTNYEVEGGEFVVNKRSYGANANLVNFINDTPRAITAADLLGVVPGDTTPVVVADAGQSSEDRIVEAINGIDFQPVVSVTDINDVSDEVVTVKDLADF